MATVNINNQGYKVHEEVAEQFSKFIRRAKKKDKEIEALKAALEPFAKFACDVSPCACYNCNAKKLILK